MPLKTLLRPMMWVGIIGVASKIMGAAGGILLAYRFGAGQVTDAYLLAKTVPLAVYLILDSVIYNTFVPLLRRPEKTDALFRSLLLLFFFGAALLAALLYFGAAHVVALLARGADAPTQLIATQLQVITAWTILYAVPASCLKAWNACQSRYVAASLDGFVISGILLATLLWTPDHMGITPVAIALPAAFVLLLIIQGFLGRDVLRLSPRTPLSDLPGRYLSRLMTPLLLLNGVQQAQVVLIVVLAAFYESGALSQVNYSYAIAQIPVGVLDLILFSTLFPFAAQLASHRKLDELRRMFHRAALALCILALPTAIWILVFRGALVDTLLTRGHFDAIDADKTTALLLGHGLAIPAWVLEALGCRVLFALGRHTRYLGMVTLRLVTFTVMAPLLTSWFGLPGISLAFALSFVVGAIATANAVQQALGQPPLYTLRPKGHTIRLLLLVTLPIMALSLLLREGLADVGTVYQLGAGAILVVFTTLWGMRQFTMHVPLGK